MGQLPIDRRESIVNFFFSNSLHIIVVPLTVPEVRNSIQNGVEISLAYRKHNPHSQGVGRMFFITST